MVKIGPRSPDGVSASAIPSSRRTATTLGGNGRSIVFLISSKSSNISKNSILLQYTLSTATSQRRAACSDRRGERFPGFGAVPYLVPAAQPPVSQCGKSLIYMVGATGIEPVTPPV